MDMKNRALAFVTDGVTNNVTVVGTFNDDDVSSQNMGAFAALTGNMVSKSRIYAVRIYEDNELVHEFLPYKNGDTVSLYDTKTGNVATKATDSMYWPTIGGKGVDGAEKWVKELPATARVPLYESVTLTAAAAGAKSYVWKKDGVVIDGETGESITINWERKGYKTPATYSCTAVYDVFGVETLGEPVSTTVTHVARGMSILVR